MIRRKRSPSRLCIGSLGVLFLLAFLLPAVKEGADIRLWILVIAVPGTLLVFGMPFLSRLFSLDRLLSVVALALCAAGVLSLAPLSPAESLNQAFLCVGALVLMLLGSLFTRMLRPAMITSLITAGLSFGVCAVPLLTDSVPVRMTDLSLPVLLVAFVSVLSLRNQLPAVLLALVGTALLLALGRPVTALIWSVTFILLFWSSSGHPAILVSGIAVVCLLFSAFRFLSPDLFSEMRSSFPDPGIRSGLFGPVSFEDLFLSESALPDSLFHLIIVRYGWILSACLVLLYPVILMRGTSLARSARSRFHGLIAMGAVLLITLHAVSALLCMAGVVSVQSTVLPGLARDVPSLGAFLFLIGMLGAVSARNREDLEEDAHLAMLAD